MTAPTIPFHVPPAGAAPSDFYLALCQNATDFCVARIAYPDFTDRSHALWRAIEAQGQTFREDVLAMWRKDNPLGGR